MTQSHIKMATKIFWPSVLITIIVSVAIGLYFPLSSFFIFLILVILEVTFSFDNAVINSKVLEKMSKFWQTLFLTVGILFAVFIVRFVLPIVIVMIASAKSFTDVINLSLNHPEQYSEVLHKAEPMINAFGGSFLIMIGVYYFLNRNKDIHWLKRTEHWLSKFSTYDSFKIIFMCVIALVLYATVDEQHKMTVLLASIVGIVLHFSLHIISEYFSKKQVSTTHLVGVAAFSSFIYLNILDASFSLDGVIGAFAITSDIIMIMAGLGVGALWVRSLTIYMVEAKTLSQYKYLEHGAHWAILVLGIIMLVKLYHIEPAEWFTGSIGLIFVVSAVISSVLEKRRRKTIDV